MIEKKKEQILDYFKEELETKFAFEYQKYDEQLIEKIQWLKDILENSPKCTRIEQLDQLANLIKKEVPTAEAMSKAELKISKLIAGKQKLKASSIWCEQRLEQVLFQIENIHYRLKQQPLLAQTSSNKKKRVVTQVSDSNRLLQKVGMFQLNPNTTNTNINQNTNAKPVIANSGSNSRFSTGRKFQH